MSRQTHITDLGIFEKTPHTRSVIKKVRLDSTESSFHYVITGNPAGQPLIFIHGAPGDWRAFEEYLLDQQLAEKFLLISVDRPGYGHSDLGNVERSLAEVSKVIRETFTENESESKPILVGHSFGGPIVIRMMMDYPDEIAHGIVLAGSLSPGADEKPWWEVIAHYPPIRWILPKDIFVTSEEIYAVKDELTKMLPYWSTISAPVTIIHGTEDVLVPIENAYFMQEKLQEKHHSFQILEGQNHFLPWNEYPRVKHSILSAADK